MINRQPETKESIFKNGLFRPELKDYPEEKMALILKIMEERKEALEALANL